ncbi:SLC4A4 [Symbiodinium sp. CCMP2592]|nr:SLC4A4 [Symbiodinium sp. CCMP2592]
MTEAEAVYRYESGYISHSAKKDYGPLDFTGRIAGGLRLDIRRRAFIAALAPAITFGSRFLDGTNGQFGVLEMIMSTSISGLIFSTFAGQPLSILGATGPFLAYTLVVYDLAIAVDIEFMPFYFWTCMWCSVFTILVAVFDLCALMKHVTMFSEDIFAGLISLIFIIDGVRPIIENFTESRLTLTNCMFESLLFLWTYGWATYLSSFRRTPWTFRAIRNFGANFAVTIALVSGSAMAAIYSNDTGLRMLQVDADFAPNLSLSDGSKRPWIVNPAGIERPFPAWGIAYAVLPAIGFAVLGYLDQNLTSVIVNRPSNNLKKPPAYHLDLFVRGALTLPVCAVLGLPLSVASTVPSITHVISLTTYEVQQLPEGERKVPTKVVEQRATNFLIHVLIGLALFLAPVLKFLPRAVLQGVFFYMGIASLTGNNLFDRLKLWLIWDPARYPQYHYVQKLPIKRVHLYTLVQVVCLGILYGLKAIKETSVVFPFFMASLAIIRKALKCMFTEEELKQLDSLPGDDDDEEVEASKPGADLVNLEGQDETSKKALLNLFRCSSRANMYRSSSTFSLGILVECMLVRSLRALHLAALRLHRRASACSVVSDSSSPNALSRAAAWRQTAKLPPAEAVYRYESGYISHSAKKDYGRAPLFCSDWTDAFMPENFQKSVSSILFIAALAPAITFGSRFLDGTNGQFGVLEMIMSTSISGLIFSTFAGQPLSILGATGPFLAYTLVVYDLAIAVDIEFMPFYFWTCMWCSVFTILVAVFDLCALMKHVTMFSEDIFAGLISLIFVIDGVRPIIENFTESRLTLTNCMFESLLFLWTYGWATYLSSFRRTPWTFRAIRNFGANFAVTIALVSGSAMAAIYSNDTGLRMLQVDADFAPNLSLSDGSKRPWIVNPAGIERPFPAWGIAYAVLPAIGFAVLGYLDQNLTSVIVNRPSNNLKKPPAYHLDLFVRGALTLPVCAVLGLPLSVASTVPSITHVISLTTYEVQQLPEGERKVPTKVVEQRATNFLIHVLIGLALFLAPVLKFLPRAVLQGVFFYMGIASLTGNNLFDRLKLWLIWDPARYPQYHYVQKLPIKRVHLYTLVQVVCLGILYGLKAIKETSVVFPFFMASLAIIRKALKCMFTEEELKQLDSLPGDDDEEVEASKPGADLVNLEGQDETSKKEEMTI